jgi:hypothetical protein
LESSRGQPTVVARPQVVRAIACNPPQKRMTGSVIRGVRHG